MPVWPGHLSGLSYDQGPEPNHESKGVHIQKLCLLLGKTRFLMVWFRPLVPMNLDDGAWLDLVVQQKPNPEAMA